MEKYDLAIVGSGVAGTFALMRVLEKNPNLKVILIDQGRPPARRRRTLEGFLGTLPSSDGKLRPSNLTTLPKGIHFNKIKSIETWLMSILSQVNEMKLIKDTLPKATTQKLLDQAGYTVSKNDYYQWKPESIHELSRLIVSAIEDKPNFNLSFDNEVYRVVKNKSSFTLNTELGDFEAKKILYCVGLSGWRNATKFYKDLGLTQEDDYANFGFKIETAGSFFKDFNGSNCTLKKGDEITIGPLSYKGQIIPVDYGDVSVAGFRSNEFRWKSDKCAFSLIGHRKFPGEGVYQADRLTKLAHLLYEDRIGKDRLKNFVRGATEINQIPEYSWLISALEEIETFMPGLIARAYFHLPCLVTAPSKINVSKDMETDIPGLHVAGESARVSGLYGAMFSSAVAIDAILK